MIRYCYIICIMFFSHVCFFQMALSDDHMAQEIMKKVDARDDGDQLTCDMEMQLIDRHNNIRKRKIRLYAKDYGKDIYSLQFFIEPPDVKNTAFLSYDYDGHKDDDQWLYLPALRKTKRIAVDDKTSSFMGSDFTYADLTKIELENYHFKLMQEQTVRDKKVWLIESIPKTDDIVRKYGYTKSILFIQQDIYVVIRAILWVHNSTTLKYMDVTSLKKIDNIWTAEQITMTTKKGKQTYHKTILNYSDIKYNQPLTDQTFTVRRMEKGL
ncbi:MAG: outer membrane lipoprotein-sorting protein [Candidatus Magnetomorum sp.]|nr:outer membrane lipoprotein-sorting protein [Candidatus Magnetomorum sp.]